MEQHEVSEYRVTFGMRYRTEQHPTLPQAHPDGWLSVWARDAESARGTVFATIGEHWAFIYPGPFDERRWLAMHPAGELARIDLTLATSAVTA